MKANFAMSPAVSARVLMFPKNGTNPFLDSFSAQLEREGALVDEFSFPRAFFRRYDVVHMHWPDTHLRTHSWWRAVGKHVRLFLLCALLRLRGTRVVWMLHNIKPHERDHWISAALFPLWFPQLCTGVIALTAFGLQKARELYPALRNKPALVVPHGDYRSAYPTAPSRVLCRNHLGIDNEHFTFLFVGNIRRYKNVPALIDAFHQLDRPDTQLVIAGQPALGVRDSDLIAQRRGNERIHLHLRFIADPELPFYLGAADLVVLPFEDVLNSGSVLLGLSFNRVVLAPRTGALPEIQQAVGIRWLRLYDDVLTPDVLIAAMNSPLPAEAEVADMSAFRWDRIARKTLAFYRGSCAAHVLT